MAFKDALKRLRKQDKLTQAELAAALGISKSAISMYECGNREPDFETQEALADYFNVDLNTLMGRMTSPLPSNIFPMPQHYTVPLIGEIACGKPILAVEDAVDTVEVPEHVHADFALRCKGDSMINARIYDGDIVYIRQQATVDDGAIAAVLVGDEATLKRVHFFPDHVVLEAANPMYQPLVYWHADMDSLRILGRAVAFTSMIN